MKKQLKDLIWYCISCQVHSPRMPGEERPRCEICNKLLHQRKLAKDGTVVTVRKGIMVDKQDEGQKLEGKTAKEKYHIFSRTYPDLSPAQKRSYLKRLWRGLFPQDEYPAKQSNWMVHLRIQYELAAHWLEEEEALPSSRFASNYEAIKRFKVKEMSDGLRELSRVYNEIEQKEEEKC